MTSFAAMFKGEITRLARKEARQYADPIRKAASSHRHDIAALKRQVIALQKELASLRRTSAKRAEPAQDAESGPQVRFVAKGLRTLRSRLGLSAADFGRLVGVSGQSVYNWEAQKAVPRRSQVAALATLRGLGKREVAARLEQAAKPAPKAKAASKGRKAKPAKAARRKKA